MKTQPAELVTQKEPELRGLAQYQDALILHDYRDCHCNATLVPARTSFKVRMLHFLPYHAALYQASVESKIKSDSIEVN